MNRLFSAIGTVFFMAITAASAEAALRLEVSLSERELYVFEDGSLTETYPVAIGQPEHPTPTGDFTINRLIWNPSWYPPDSEWAEDKEPKSPGDPDNPMKMVKIFFKEPDYYIHGTDATDTLQEPASHGCLRMKPWHAAEVAKKVMENGGRSKPQSWYNATIESDTTKEIHLPSPVRIVIQE